MAGRAGGTDHFRGHPGVCRPELVGAHPVQPVGTPPACGVAWPPAHGRGVGPVPARGSGGKGLLERPRGGTVRAAPFDREVIERDLEPAIDAEASSEGADFARPEVPCPVAHGAAEVAVARAWANVEFLAAFATMTMREDAELL